MATSQQTLNDAVGLSPVAHFGLRSGAYILFLLSNDPRTYLLSHTLAL